MQADKELKVMFSTKEITTIVKYIVTRFALAAFVVVLGLAGSAAASNRPKPTVISTDPADDATNVPVNTTVTVVFSLPIDCHSINRKTFEIKASRRKPLAAERITCSGSTAIFTPRNDLAINTRYEVVFHGRITALNGRNLWANGFGYDFTTGPNTEPPATATPTATATSTATATATSTATATATATNTATPTSTSTATDTATATATTTPTASATNTATATATATDTAQATAT